MQESREYYVYALIEPVKLDTPYVFSFPGQEDFSLSIKPFYIGKGKRHRVYDHFKEAEKYSLEELKTKNLKVNKHKIYKIKQQKGVNASIRMFTDLSEKEAYEIEEMIISQIGLTKLTNIRGGGENSSLGDRTKRVLSESRIGKSFEERLGKDKAKIAKDKLSKRYTGCRNNRYGRNDQVYKEGGLFDHSTKIKKGKKIEDWMGEEKAKKWKESRSKNYIGLNNPNCKYNYDFIEIFNWFLNKKSINDYCIMRGLVKDKLQRLLRKIDINWNTLSIRRPKDYEKTLNKIKYWNSNKEELYKKAYDKNLLSEEQYNTLINKARGCNNE